LLKRHFSVWWDAAWIVAYRDDGPHPYLLICELCRATKRIDYVAGVGTLGFIVAHKKCAARGKEVA
jgi:hypothetical protein